MPFLGNGVRQEVGITISGWSSSGERRWSSSGGRRSGASGSLTRCSAAIKSGAGIIVTLNRRDFPSEELAGHGIVALHPDVFAMELLTRSPAVVLDVLATQAADLKHPPHTTLDVVAALERCGLPRFGAAVRAGGLLG